MGRYGMIDASWTWILDWITRMQDKHEGWVHDKETGKSWDWGQALCRELYGPGWNDSPEHRADDMQEIAPPHIRQCAERWEAGEWPEWVQRETKEVPDA